MSTFAVTIETIRATHPIPEAERIEVATLEGMDFQFVIGKGAWRAGDRVLYFPVDSLLPLPLAERLGVAGRLAGKDKNRLKTITLRGQISQGLVASLELLPEGLTDPAQITEALGVTKYEPPENIVNDAILTRLPEGQGKYDIESADRYVDVAALLADQPVFITEKVEGSNLWVRAEPDGTVTVGQREHTLEPREGVQHTYHILAQRLRLDELVRGIARQTGLATLIYGEALGPKIQGNIYNLAQHTIRIFDLRVGPTWAPPAELISRLTDHFGDTDLLVPVLQRPDGTTLRDWLAGRSVKDASNGQSLLAKRLREGIVIRPLVEQRHPAIGRLVLKQRSPTYLAKSEL